ncbi:MAG TPA: S26 family signal peptidase [Candidatus Saccharimonadales bacterium]
MLAIGIRRVIGNSMSPYLNDGRLIIVSRSKKYKVGDVVGFRFDSQILIKRVSRVKDSSFYVLGDNSNNSLDSRKLGWIDSKNITFKLRFRL